jgi:hypothetical protein
VETYAIDFETTYSSDNNISQAGQWHYLRNKETDVYMVSIVGPGVSFVGAPKDAPWDKIHGHRWVAHNYSFDGAVMELLRERGLTKALPSEYFCTANLAAFMGAPRNLGGASKELLGKVVDKDPRAFMKGKTWADVLALGKAEEIRKYALGDAISSLELWSSFSDRMPEMEKKLSRHTVEMGWRGFNVDSALVDAGLNTLDWARIKASEKLPWKGDDDHTGDVLKMSGLAKACRDAGIEVPASTSEDDPACQRWEDQYGEAYPWVSAMRDWRKSNMLFSKLEILWKRRRPDGTVPYGLKYFGAQTGRWSGDSKFNVQNLPKESMFGVDLRACIVPRAGKKFIISDLAQIEPRVLAWLCGDEVLLNAVRTGYGIYEAFAVSTGMWSGAKGSLKRTDPAIYALSKAQVLGLGYGCGAKKFVLVSKLMAGLEIDDVRSKQLVDSYRRKNPKVVALWHKLERGFKGSQREDYMVELPSGRQQKYFGITTQKGATGKPDWRASVTLAGPKFAFWGGKLTENLVQATARDVFGEAILRLEEAGLPVVAHIHDEVILEVDTDVDCEDINNLMAVTPEWLQGCPIAAESHEADCYKK